MDRASTAEIDAAIYSVATKFDDKDKDYLTSLKMDDAKVMSQIITELETLSQKSPAPTCDLCGDTGLIWDQDQHKIIGDCHCAKSRKDAELATWKREETRRLKSILLPKINLVETEKRAWYAQLPESGGVWISGPAGCGKTHAVGWLLAKKISQAEKPFSWSWFSARQVLEAWSGQYSDDWEVRDRSRRVINDLARCRVVVINDIDKIGKMTEAREEHFFDLIDGMHGREAEFLVPSNINLNDFCLRMGGEDLFTKRDGLGPIQRRLRELCKQINAGEYNGK